MSAPDHRELSAIYKRKGSFDKQRKQLLQNFKSSQTHENLLLKVKLMVELKVKSDPSILLKNRGKMAALIQGEIISGSGSGTSSILSIVDKDIREKIIDSPDFHENLNSELKDIRRQCLGISDEDYAAQLAEEKKAREEEAERREREKAERETAYKNNFKVKQLSAPSKPLRPPRFNLHTMRDSYRGFASRSGGTDDKSRHSTTRPGSGGLMY